MSSDQKTPEITKPAIQGRVMGKKEERRIRANRIRALQHGATSNSPVIPGTEL